MAISPRDRRLGFWSWALACFLRRGGHLDEALEEVRLSRQRDPRLFLAPLLEAVLLASAGEAAEAAEAAESLATARRLHPPLSLEDVEVALGHRAAESLGEIWRDTDSPR
jgi:hypothetical protein